MSDIPQAPDWWQANDGKWYPPQPGQAAPDPFQQMQQGTQVPGSGMGTNLGGMGFQVADPTRGMMRLVTIITVATLLIGGAITAYVLFTVDDAVDSATDTIDDTFDTDNEAIDSVEVTDCGRDEFGRAQGTLDITNDGDGTATYFVTVVFESRNGNRQFGSANATISGLAAGNTTQGETLGAVEVPEGQRFTCRVTEVDRIQS